MKRADVRRQVRAFHKLVGQANSGHLTHKPGVGRAGRRKLKAEKADQLLRTTCERMIGEKDRAVATRRLVAHRDRLRQDRARRFGRPARALFAARRDMRQVGV